jgi:hypothetical protein
MRNPFAHRNDAPIALITITVMLGLIMAIIDSTIVNVALDTIGGNLGASIDEVSWVATGYILANVVVMPLNGWLTAYLGRKRLYGDQHHAAGHLPRDPRHRRRRAPAHGASDSVRNLPAG